MFKNSNRGISTLVAIGIVAVLIVVGSSAYFIFENLKNKRIYTGVEEEQQINNQKEEVPEKTLEDNNGGGQQTLNNKQSIQSNKNTATSLPKYTNIKIDSALVNTEIENCKKKSEYERAICSFDLALLFKNKQLCDINPYMDKAANSRDFCLAIVGKDTNICQSFSNGLDVICSAIVEKNYNKCTGLEKELNEMCTLLVDNYNNLLNNGIFDNFQQYCENNVVYRGNTNIVPFWFKTKGGCYKFSIDKIIEYGTIASYDENICSYEKDDFSKDSCYNIIAIKRKNSEICNSIGNPTIKAMCFSVAKGLK